MTGAAGGVGSVAVALLAKLGYQVIASTGRPQEADYLKGLGAAEIIDRAELAGPVRPLAKERWAGGIDSVGSTTLANVLSMTKYGGAVAACGLAGGMDLPTSVAPFILRGVSLFGIDSVQCPPKRRKRPGGAWLPTSIAANLQAMTSEIGLADVIEAAGTHPRRPGAGSNRGQDWVKTFRIWRRTSGMIAAIRYGNRPVNARCVGRRVEWGMSVKFVVWRSCWPVFVGAVRRRPRR